MIQPGTRIGDRYEIESIIDEGGMARVYRTRDLKLNRVVALKMIRQESFSPSILEEVFGRFELEAAALARLSHPNIVSIMDFGKHEGTPFVVMTYVEGGTLKKFQGKPLPIERAARLLSPIARALGYAHLHGFVHRDVKPSNILLTESDEPLLSDFGLVKDVDNRTAQVLTSTGVSIGTPEYMAPEQALGEKVDGRADIYALGAVLYELVTGDRPYKADSPLAVVLRKSSEQPPDPRQANPSLPGRAVEVIRKAMAHRVEERYQSMAAFEEALDELRGSAPRSVPSAPPPAYDSERTMITPSRAVPIAPPAPPAPAMENNATVQMPPLRPAAQAPPPGAAENMPTMQMGMSTPISRPLAGAPPPPVEDLPTMPMGVSLPSSSKPPEKSPPLQEMGEMKTMAMPAFQPPPPAAIPPYAPPPAPGGYPAAPDFPAPVETSRRASNLPRLALFGGGALLLVVLVVVAIIVFGGSDTPLAGAKISETPTATDAPQLTATARPSSTSAPTTTPVPSETPIPTPVPTATPLPATIVQQDAEMILIPASAFAMGCDATNIHEVCSEIEEPVHSVKLDAYYIDKYEVTNAQYKACVAAGACQPPQEVFSFIRSDYYTNAQFDNYPVIYVTWQDANQFCSWRGGRLPSEAEWEKAARGNIDQRVYPWGNTAPSCALANFNPGEHCKRDPNAVGSYPEGASLFGVMDMSGNVSEWVADWFLFNYYQSSPAENPTGPNSGTSRVLRGGSWTNNLNKLQVSNRDNLEPGIASNNIGFRCVLTP